MKANQSFSLQALDLPDAFLIKPFVAYDNRGAFVKDYSQEVFAGQGVLHDLKEVFYTESYKGVVRAIHFQKVKPQPKLVRCVSGAIFDVIVDLRAESAFFGQWRGFMLTGANHDELLVPAGCGHGYLVLEDSIVSYKCSEKFYGEYDDGILWSDPEIAVDWPLAGIGGAGNVILSEKDEKLQTFARFKVS